MTLPLIQNVIQGAQDSIKLLHQDLRQKEQRL